MLFSVDKNTIMDALSSVGGAVSNLTDSPILQGIKITVKDGTVEFTGSNIDTIIISSISVLDYEEGTCIVDGRMLIDYVKKLPNDRIKMSLNNNILEIQCKKSKFQLQNIVGEYPTIPIIEDVSSIKITQKELKQALQQTMFAAAKEETRPMLTCVCLEANENTISFAALDGYRLAVKQLEIKNAKQIKILIPAKSLGEILKNLQNDGDVNISVSKNYVLFETDKNKTFIRLMNEQFIQWQRIIPEGFQNRVVVNTKELLSAIERAAITSKAGNSIIVLEVINNNSFKITSACSKSMVEEYVDIKIQEGSKGFNNFKMAFNYQFLYEQVRFSLAEQIYMDFTTNLSPCVISTENFKGLVLPVRITDEMTNSNAA